MTVILYTGMIYSMGDMQYSIYYIIYIGVGVEGAVTVSLETDECKSQVMLHY